MNVEGDKGAGLLEEDEPSNFKILLRDLSPRMVAAWEDCAFGTDDKYKGKVQVSTRQPSPLLCSYLVDIRRRYI